MGNRGILHNEYKELATARWRHKAWVTCSLSFKNRHREVMSPGTYTELFFLDEAVAFAAGHRPCAECRRDAYKAFRAAAGITGCIKSFDDQLHAQRATARPYRQIRYQSDIAALPVGTFVLSSDGEVHLLGADHLLPYTAGGYAPAVSRPKHRQVTVLTPRPLVNVLRAGYDLKIATGAQA
jgi:hypothetical protein